MSFNKKSNLSARSKRRRVQEELQNSSYYEHSYNTSQTITNNEYSQLNVNTFIETFINTSISQPVPDEVLNESLINQNQDYVSEFFNELDTNTLCLFSSSSSESEEEKDDQLNETNDQIFIFSKLIAQWAVDCNIPQTALNKLLVLLKTHKCFKFLPKDSRTILMHKNSVGSYNNNFHTVEPGTYYHFGLLNGIKNNFPESSKDETDISIVVGVDGLPIFKSNPEQFWPILAYIRPENNNVFPIGIYCGKEKPADSNEFMKQFINEAKLLIDTGISINNKVYNLKIDNFCCDAPAKSFLLKTKGHSGFYSCTRCETEGKYLLNRMCFPYTSLSRCPPKRTHTNYIRMSNEDHHIGNLSIISTLPSFDVVTCFSLDYMHLVCLGVVRKMILLWIKGPINIRYPSWKIKQISKHIEDIKVNMSCEFARKPRKLDEVNRWKATEFRTFLLYIGTILTKPVLTDEHWKHFFGFSIAMLILISPDKSKYIHIARKLLDNFVKNFEIIYGQHFISHNIHGITHICDDYEKFGPLDNCSAFPFENYMGSLKRMLRKPHKPLQQIVKRYDEICCLKSTIGSKKKTSYQFGGPHKRGPIIENEFNDLNGDQFTSIILESMKIKINVDADSYLLTNDDNIVKVFNIIHNKNMNEVILICKKFKNKSVMFNSPIKSSKLDIYVVDQLCNDYIWYHIYNMKKKVIILQTKENLIALPIVHSTSS